MVTSISPYSTRGTAEKIGTPDMRAATSICLRQVDGNLERSGKHWVRGVSMRLELSRDE